MVRYTLLALIVILLAFGCSPDTPVTEHPSEMDQIHEAIFRHQFESNASALGQSATAYFLRVGDQDPDPHLLRQFADHHPPVKPVSASNLESGTAQVQDSESGLPGLIFWITSIRWLGSDEVELQGGYEEASESAAGSAYHLRKGNTGWEVVSSQMLWIK
jgi:hypothetical protein